MQIAVQHHQAGRLQQAETIYQQVLQAHPQHAHAWHLLGVIAHQRGHHAQAVELIQQAIALQPNFPDAYSNLGVTLKEAGRLEEAIACYRRATQLVPDDPVVHVDLAHVLLMQGDLIAGFREYEWRWHLPEAVPRSFKAPYWDGADLTRQTILLHAEQGLGDTLQFIRYAPLVAEQGGRVIVECEPSLVSLLRTVAGVEQVIGRGEALPEFQVHCPLLSLPRLLGTTLETIPAQVPYLSAPPATLSLITPPNTRLKVGFVWASGYRTQPKLLQAYRQKSCPLSMFLRLLAFPDVSLYSLQVGRDAAALSFCSRETRIQDLSPQLQNFADTAAAIAQLDLIISVDTAVAHLAGALGKPIWLLLPHHAEWRWLQHRDDSPWYPTLRLFRQAHPEDWESVWGQVVAAIAELRTAAIC